MASPKPIASWNAWATNANYTTGPKLGSPTKVAISAGEIAEGHRPGATAPTAAEKWNTWLNDLSGWIGWLESGSAAGPERAHVVEGDANGQINPKRAVIGPHTSGTSLSVVGNTSTRALNVQGGAGQQGARILAGTGGAGGLEVQGSDSGSIAAITAIGGSGTSTGSGVYGQGGAGGGRGVFGLGTVNQPGVEGSGNGTGAGLKGTGGATGPGVSASGGSTSGPGVTAVGGGNVAGVIGSGKAGTTGRGVQGNGGDGGGDGVYGEGGGGGRGVVGVGGSGGGAGGSFTAGADSAYGLDGLTTATATGGVAAVRGIAQGDAYGVVAQADTTTPARAALRIVPQNADPSSPAAGDLMYNSATNEFRARNNTAWRTVWTTPDGLTFDYDEVASYALTATSWTAISSITLSAPRAGFAIVWVSLVVDENTAVSCDLRVRNTTKATTYWSQTGVDVQTTVIPGGIVCRVALDAGANTIELQGQVAGGQYDLTEINTFGLGML